MSWSHTMPETIDKRVFTVPETLAGKTLTQLQQEQYPNFRLDIVANQLGISPTSQLTKGQEFTIPYSGQFAPGGAEYGALTQFFGQPVTQAQSILNKQETQE